MYFLAYTQEAIPTAFHIYDMERFTTYRLGISCLRLVVFLKWKIFYSVKQPNPMHDLAGRVMVSLRVYPDLYGVAHKDTYLQVIL